MCASWPQACITPTSCPRVAGAHLRGEGQAGLLRHRQRVHVGAQRDDGAGQRAAQHAHHAGLRDAGAHLEAERGEPLGHHGGRARLAVATARGAGAGRGASRSRAPRCAACGARSRCRGRPRGRRRAPSHADEEPPGIESPTRPTSAASSKGARVPFAAIRAAGRSVLMEETRCAVRPRPGRWSPPGSCGSRVRARPALSPSRSRRCPARCCSRAASRACCSGTTRAPAARGRSGRCSACCSRCR